MKVLLARLRESRRDLLWAVLPFVVLAAVVALLWPQLVTPSLATRTETGVSTTEVELGNRFSADGWFVLLGAGGSLLIGGLLMARRRTDELLVLLVALVASLVLSYAAAWFGPVLGPPDPVSVLTDAEVGATAPSQVRTSSRAVHLAWPLGTAIGALVVLLATRRLEQDGPFGHPQTGRESDARPVTGD